MVSYFFPHVPQLSTFRHESLSSDVYGTMYWVGVVAAGHTGGIAVS